MYVIQSQCCIYVQHDLGISYIFHLDLFPRHIYHLLLTVREDTNILLWNLCCSLEKYTHLS